MEKIRPAIIMEVLEESNEILVQKLTTKKHKMNKVFDHPKMKRKTYLTNEIIKINEYNLIRYIGNLSQEKRVKR